MLCWDTVEYNPLQERIVALLNKKTRNYNKAYFRTLTLYHMCRIASMQRTNILLHDGQTIPINAYVLNLAPSGFGKGRSMNIVEDDILGRFTETFLNTTIPKVVECSIREYAKYQAAYRGTSQEEEYERLFDEYKGAGEYMTSFAEGTSPALKQMRNKLLLGSIGSLNQEVDEIGYNLQKNADLLQDYLELYDVGKVKDKLIKNTKENQRTTQLTGRTPANVIMFGVPDTLLDGGVVETLFWSFQTSGYARRSFFGWGDTAEVVQMDLDTIYKLMSAQSTSADQEYLQTWFADLADISYYNKTLTMSEEVAKTLLRYQLHCEHLASSYPTQLKCKKAEMHHRYFKAIKLAGGYAWCEKADEITMTHLLQAIKQTEESGASFQKVLIRERNYEKLAKYLGECEEEVTHADLTADLPYYPTQRSQRESLLELAIAYGYRHNILIKRKYSEGIEFISGEALKETDLRELSISYTSGHRHDANGTFTIAHPVDGFKHVRMSFEQLAMVTQASHIHWLPHALKDGTRNDANVIPGFNLVVLDIDGTLPLPMAKLVLEKYTYHIYTTKRHTEESHRYRVILPISHELKLDKKDYNVFMSNLLEWFPAEVDESCKVYSQKWQSHKGEYWENTGELLDARQFIPNTTKCEEYTKQIVSLQSLPRLERYFCMRASTGNRNQTIIKYALMLVDCGCSLAEIEDRVKDLNAKLSNPLSKKELEATIFSTVAKRVSNMEKENETN